MLWSFFLSLEHKKSLVCYLHKGVHCATCTGQIHSFCMGLSNNSQNSPLSALNLTRSMVIIRSRLDLQTSIAWQSDQLDMKEPKTG